MAYWVRTFTAIDSRLRTLDICLVGSAIVHSLGDPNPVFPTPGFSFDPLSTLSFSQPGLEGLAVPFTPELQHQHGVDVSCLPFSISPVQLPKVAKSLVPSQLDMPDSVTFDPKSVDFTMVRRLPYLVPRCSRDARSSLRIRSCYRYI